MANVRFRRYKAFNLLRTKWLRLPDYQRGYCWERKQIESLLESIWDFWDNKDGNPTLHLGTVVLHLHGGKENGETVLDVVDGQQRLVTLSILFHVLGLKKGKDNSIIEYSLLSSEITTYNVQTHIYWARRIIEEWIGAHGDRRGCLVELMRKNITIDAVIIRGENNLGLAYTFFNAINSAGKKLTDYDLLKPHHLRYPMGEDQKAYLASQWDLFVQEKVLTFGGGEASLADELVNCTLYRLRSWAQGRWISDERHHVFEHFQAHHSLSDKMIALSRVFSYRDGIGGGVPFFTYIIQFASNYRQFVRTNAVSALYGGVNADKNRVLWNAVRSVLFQYFCRFGYAYLEDALLFITERLGRIRADNPQLVEKRVLQNAIFCHTVTALDEATSPEYFFYYCVMPTNRYALKGDDDIRRTRVRPAFWDSAREMFKLMGQYLMFSDDLKWCCKDSDGRELKEGEKE